MTYKPREPAHVMPASQLLSLVELVADWGVQPEAFLAGSPWSVHDLERSSTRIPFEAYDALVSRARELTGEPALGVYMGLRRRFGMYGVLGLAALSASSLGQVLETAERYLPVFTTAVRLSLRVEREVAMLRFEELVDSGHNRDVATFALVVTLDRLFETLVGRRIELEAHAVIPKPDYHDRFTDVLPKMRFDQPALQLVFDAQHLSLEPVAAHRICWRAAVETLDHELQELANRSTFVEQVRAWCSSSDGTRSLKEIAARLDVSPRTLKRKLSAERVRFAELLQSERMQRADLLLRTSRLSLSEIATRVGYATLPSFSRAFRRWTGQTPDDYRRSTSRSE